MGRQQLFQSFAVYPQILIVYGTVFVMAALVQTEFAYAVHRVVVVGQCQVVAVRAKGVTLANNLQRPGSILGENAEVVVGVKELEHLPSGGLHLFCRPLRRRVGGVGVSQYFVAENIVVHHDLALRV